jgi:hypothetical protein
VGADSAFEILGYGNIEEIMHSYSQPIKDEKQGILK